MHRAFPQLGGFTALGIIVKGRYVGKLLFSQFDVINEPTVVIAVTGRVFGQLDKRGVNEKYVVRGFAKVNLQALETVTQGPEGIRYIGGFDE